MVRKIIDKVPDDMLKLDLEKYRQQALALGASDAKIITSDAVLVDERVRGKCIYPRCNGYGTSANCPPYAMSLDETRKLLNKFTYGVFIKLDVPPEEVAGIEARDKRLYARSSAKNNEIVSKIETDAFFDGYHLAIAFAGGSCKNLFCPDKDCSALALGGVCRQPLRARASMEAVGMDAFTMAARVGWDIYPIGAATSPSEVSHGTRLGLVLIY